MSKSADGAAERWPHLTDGPEGWRRQDDAYVARVQEWGTVEYYILHDKPTRAPLDKANGEPIYFEQTRELLIQTSEGSKLLYGCKWCDYVRESVGAIRPHLARHNRKGPSAPVKPATPEMSLSDALASLADVAKLTASVEEWKTRALKAEKELRRFKTMFKSLGE
jgi:hypothetical protein